MNSSTQALSAAAGAGGAGGAGGGGGEGAEEEEGAGVRVTEVGEAVIVGEEEVGEEDPVA